jgi:hypothetical protein
MTDLETIQRLEPEILPPQHAVNDSHREYLERRVRVEDFDTFPPAHKITIHTQPLHVQTNIDPRLTGEGKRANPKANCRVCHSDEWGVLKLNGQGCDICHPELFHRRLDERPDYKPEIHGMPRDAAARKGIPVFSGLLKYFPHACAAVAQLSRIGNDQHNPGQPLHWAKDKSTDEPDCIARHLLDYAVDAQHRDPDGVLAATKIAWRALANLERLHDAGHNIFAVEHETE